MSPKIFITFQNESRVFFPGQPVAGIVQVNADSEISCKAISLKLKGFANVHFTERENKTRGTGDEHKTESVLVHYRNSENYYVINMKLWNSIDNQTLSSGHHQFPFTFMIPTGAPSSFESKIGQVRHLCKATIETSFFRRNHSCLMPYSVVSISDLNTMPVAMEPILASDDKTLCCLCCASGPLSLLINVSRSGYVPGENIVINAECSNKSNRIIKSTKVELLQCVTYIAKKVKKEQKVVSFKEHSSIPSGGDDIWAGELFPIPPLPPSGLPGCGIIDIKYLLKFSMVPSGPAMDLTIEREIIIATIPLRNLFNHFVPRTSSVASPKVDNPPAYNEVVSIPSAPLLFPGLDMYPDLPPPSYNDCSFGLSTFEYDTSDDEQSGQEKSSLPPFAPQYVSYNLGPMPNASAPLMDQADYSMNTILIQDV